MLARAERAENDSASTERSPGDRSGAILAARATPASAALRWEKQSPRLGFDSWVLLPSDVQRRTAACYRLRNTCGDLREEMRYEAVDIFWQLDCPGQRS